MLQNTSGLSLSHIPISAKSEKMGSKTINSDTLTSPQDLETTDEILGLVQEPDGLFCKHRPFGDNSLHRPKCLEDHLDRNEEL